MKWFSDCTILVTYSIFWRSSKCLEVWIIQQLFTLQTLQGDFLHNLFLTLHFWFILWISVTNPKSKIWESLFLIEHKTNTVTSKLQNKLVTLCWCTITERQVKGVYQFDYCNSVITRSSESTGKKLVITDSGLFHIRKQIPHPPSFRMRHQSVYFVYSNNTQTFINRGINSVCW